VLLAHTRFGDGGRPVVLLHGFLGSGRNLTSLARGVAAQAPELSVYTFDLTGHGGSPPLPHEADLATLARDVLQSARALDLAGPVALVGHSLGGRVALRACLLDRAAVADVVLLDIGPSPVPDAGDVPHLLTLLRHAPDAAPSRDVFRAHFRAGNVEDALIEWLLLNVQHEAGVYRWRIDRRGLAALHARTGGEDLWTAVEGPRTWRVRCLRGERSSYVPGPDVTRLQAAGCPVTTVEGAGHFLHVDRPTQVRDLLAGHFRPSAQPGPR
jgi:esterase